MTDELTDDEAVRMHRVLAAYHDRLAKAAILDIVHEYHVDLAERFKSEADHIPDRSAARERVLARHREREDE